MTEVPEVSVIVPVYNGADTLEGALVSILTQECTDLEVIVVDDDSTDASAAVAGRYGPPVCCLRRANGGPSAARNQGVDLARSRFVSFLVADDTWPAGCAITWTCSHGIRRRTSSSAPHGPTRPPAPTAVHFPCCRRR